jgi:NTP pyrophosphatase (non-canonical NTP hydrolase)
MTLKEMQTAHNEWARRNFGPTPPYRALLGAMEELGELAHAHLKEEQGIRGTTAKHEEDAKDAVADTVIYLIDYCNLRGWDFEALLMETWSRVSQRDWKKNPTTG